MRNLMNSIVMAGVASMMMLPLASQALEDKGYFSCNGEKSGEYLDPDSCTQSIICSGSKKEIKACPEGEVINSRKPPPWKCEPVEVAGMTPDCKLIAKPADSKKHGK